MASSDFNYTVEFANTEEIIKHLQESVKNLVVEREFTPKHIIHNRKTDETIVIWMDGTRTTVRPMMGVPHSPYSAFTAALAKKVYGSNTKVNKIVAKTFEPVTKAEKQHRCKLDEQARHLMNVASNLKEKENLERIAELMGDEKP